MFSFKLLIALLSLSRITLGVWSYHLIKKNDVNFFMLVFLLVCISDILDGFLSRKFKIDSKVGGVLDVICDFIYITICCLGSVLKKLVPWWLLIVMLMKFVDFLISSFLVNTKQLVYDFIGKCLALFLYVLPVILVVVHEYYNDLFSITYFVVIVCVLLMSVVSFFARIRKISLLRDF